MDCEHPYLQGSDIPLQLASSSTTLCGTLQQGTSSTALPVRILVSYLSLQCKPHVIGSVRTPVSSMAVFRSLAGWQTLASKGRRSNSTLQRRRYRPRGDRRLTAACVRAVLGWDAITLASSLKKSMRPSGVAKESSRSESATAQASSSAVGPSEAAVIPKSDASVTKEARRRLWCSLSACSSCVLPSGAGAACADPRPSDDAARRQAPATPPHASPRSLPARVARTAGLTGRRSAQSARARSRRHRETSAPPSGGGGAGVGHGRPDARPGRRPPAGACAMAGLRSKAVYNYREKWPPWRGSGGRPGAHRQLPGQRRS